MSDIFDENDLKAVNAGGAQPAAKSGIFDEDMIKAVSATPSAKPVQSEVKPDSAAMGFLKGAASLADTAYGVVPGVLGGATYAISRALGNSPETSEQSASTVSSAIDKPVGKAFGITNDPAYKNEASNQAMQFVSQNVGKGAAWISDQTGLPKADVENMIGSLTMAAPAIIKKGANVLGDAAVQTVAQDLERPAPKPSAYEQARASYDNAPQSGASPSQYAPGGASAATLAGRLSTATDAARADAEAQVSAAKEKYGDSWSQHIDWGAMDRQLNADSLPIPGRLTRGQASGNGALISDEWNHRSTNGLGQVFAAQNINQAENLRAIREQASPDLSTSTIPADHAQTLIKSYKNLDTIDSKVINDKWDAIRAQSGDRPIFDANQMLSDSQAALKKNLLSSQDPGGQLAELMDAARTRGGLSADGYKAFRQNLGQIAMKGGAEGKAASLVIDATNKSTLLPEAAQFRDSVNDALASGRALHTKLENDPAYKAVAEGNASTKDFVNKFIVNGKPENVAQMKNNLVGDDVANQTMRAAVLDHLRGAAALDEQYQGNFAAKNFNKNLSNITPVARAVFDDGELQRLRDLGDYSSHISNAGRDSWKNFSNTATELQTPASAAISHASKVIGVGAEAALAHHTGGISIPFVGAIKEGARVRAARKAALEEEENAAQYLHESTRPMAGIIKE